MEAAFAWSAAAALRISRALGRGAADDRGVSAVEFALLAPILSLSLVAAADLGLAEYQRMTIDHALRAGAQAAVADRPIGEVSKAAERTLAKHFQVATSGGSNPEVVALSVKRYCACPEKTSVEVVCSTVCTASAPPFIFNRLSASKQYQAMIVPNFALNSAVQVQIR